MSVTSTVQNTPRRLDQLNKLEGREKANQAEQQRQVRSNIELTRVESSPTPATSLTELSRSVLKKLTEEQEQFGNLARSPQDRTKSLRRDQVERIKDNILQLKPIMMFASPEQAHQLAQELEKLGRDFKEAAKSLGEQTSVKPSALPQSVLPKPAEPEQGEALEGSSDTAAAGGTEATGQSPAQSTAAQPHIDIKV